MVVMQLLIVNPSNGALHGALRYTCILLKGRKAQKVVNPL